MSKKRYLSTPNKGLLLARNKRIMELHAQGLSPAIITQRLGLPRGSAYKVIAKETNADRTSQESEPV